MAHVYLNNHDIAWSRFKPLPHAHLNGTRFSLDCCFPKRVEAKSQHEAPP